MEKLDRAKEFSFNDTSYQEILPGLEKENPNSFWDSKFNDLSYESLLSDCFNRSEDEFEFHISLGEEIMQTLSTFNGDKWNDLSVEEREKLIDKLVEGICDELGIDDIPFVAYYEADEFDCGFYDYSDNSVSINELFLDNPREIVEILAHEMRHAYQHQRADIGETQEDLIYQCNLDNYIKPIELPDKSYIMFFDYQDQYVEAEARAYSNAFMEGIGW